jgi:hypothetical protein
MTRTMGERVISPEDEEEHENDSKEAYVGEGLGARPPRTSGLDSVVHATDAANTATTTILLQRTPIGRSTGPVWFRHTNQNGR